MKVWRAVIIGLLVADVGHILSVYVKDQQQVQQQLEDQLVETMGGGGWGVYYKIHEWNEMDWGNLGFVYFAAMVRIMFLLGVGLGRSSRSSNSIDNSNSISSESRQDDKKEL